MAKDTENAEIIMAKEVRQDMRKSGIPIVESNKAALSVIGNRDLSNIISKYGGKRRKRTAKKTHRRRSQKRRTKTKR